MSHEAVLEAPAKRPGRPRDESARQRILAAALDLLDELGFAAATVDAIAMRAAVGKATVYRWWPNKTAVIIEAFREAVAPDLPFPNSGSVEGDIRIQMSKFNAMLMGPRGRTLSAIVAAAQSDPEVASALWNEWVGPRRAQAKAAMLQDPTWPSHADPDLLMDLLYGPLYYCLLFKRLTLSPEYAQKIADLAIAAVRC